MSSEQACVLNDVYNLLLDASFDPKGQDIEIDCPAHSTPVGQMANFDHQNKFQIICLINKGDG